MERGMDATDTTISNTLLIITSFFSAVFIYSSKVFSSVAVSDPSNKDDR
jgi:hypothetical protein